MQHCSLIVRLVLLVDKKTRIVVVFLKFFGAGVILWLRLQCLNCVVALLILFRLFGFVFEAQVAICHRFGCGRVHHSQ